MNRDEFINQLANRGINIDSKTMEQLNIYAQFLKEYNEKVNLTSIVDYEEVLDKHFYDSLLLVKGELKGSLVDVGTGAGFPGVVLKIVFPNLKVVLLEPLKKRCVFLQCLIEKLGLEDIEVINQRGEDYSKNHRQEYDYVTARAVSNLNNLLEICGAMVKVDGYFIALRGMQGLQELQDASKAIDILNFKVEKVYEEALFNGDKRVIAYLRKLKPTSLKYPRNYSIIKKLPL